MCVCVCVPSLAVNSIYSLYLCLVFSLWRTSSFFRWCFFYAVSSSFVFTCKSKQYYEGSMRFIIYTFFCTPTIMSLTYAKTYNCANRNHNNRIYSGNKWFVNFAFTPIFQNIWVNNIMKIACYNCYSCFKNAIETFRSERALGRAHIHP